jgi:hypothetical protein
MERESERTKVLMEQYKLLEERRKTFGNQFMQVIGFSIALFTLLVGFLGGKNEAFFSVVLRVSGRHRFVERSYAARVPLWLHLPGRRAHSMARGIRSTTRQ